MGVFPRGGAPAGSRGRGRVRRRRVVTAGRVGTTSYTTLPLARRLLRDETHRPGSGPPHHVSSPPPRPTRAGVPPREDAPVARAQRPRWRPESTIAAAAPEPAATAGTAARRSRELRHPPARENEKETRASRPRAAPRPRRGRGRSPCGSSSPGLRRPVSPSSPRPHAERAVRRDERGVAPFARGARREHARRAAVERARGWDRAALVARPVRPCPSSPHAHARRAGPRR